MKTPPPPDRASQREAVIARLRADRAPELAQRAFLRDYDRLAAGATGLIDQTMIQPVASAPDIEKEPDRRSRGLEMLPRTAVLKLNGGLGTSMGLEKAKSLLPVRDGHSFLDLIAGQVLHARRRLGKPLPLLLMNSFSTDADTRRALEAHPELGEGQAGFPLTFLQHRVPKIDRATLGPVSWPEDPEKEWCPPGHGDLYTALQTSGLLERLLEKGIALLFVSNADNLGATLDLNILGYAAATSVPFLMEVADRTEADRKGGHLAQRKDGRLVLRESAQCPEDEQALFQDVGLFRYFNTNNLWIHLPSLAALLDRYGGVPDLPLIRNAKQVDPTREDSPGVYQLETAMGAALGLFESAGALRVPRRRFAPVKTTEDLLAVASDCFVLNEDMTLSPSPEREGRPIVIRLDPAYYRHWKDFAARFPDGPPSLARCSRLTVRGDVRFCPRTKLEGAVAIEHTGPGQLVYPS